MYDTNDTVLDCQKPTVKYPTFSERLRPRTIDELLIPESSIAKFNAMIQSRDVMNMIFYGSAGTGKTTCAQLISNSPNYELLYLNPSLPKGRDDIRNQIEPFATSMSLYSSIKIVLLDSADYLSFSAQSALRGLIEKSTGNCRFILTANELNKIQEPIQSRCRPFCFDVPFVSLNASIAKLTQTIRGRLREMNVEIDESRLQHIVAMKFPDYRAIANDIEFEMI